MPLTSEGVLKTLVQSLLQPIVPGLIAYRKRAPAGQARPYVTIQGRISVVPGPSEDGGSGTALELAQIDLWQDWKDLVTGAITENYPLLAALEHGLHGARTAPIGARTAYPLHA